MITVAAIVTVLVIFGALGIAYVTTPRGH